MTTIKEKADHVRKAIADGKTGYHTCHWPGCTKSVPPAAWGCRPHWYALPAPLRHKIWTAYRPGQEDTKTPSASYIVAAREVRKWIEENKT